MPTRVGDRRRRRQSRPRRAGPGRRRSGSRAQRNGSHSSASSPASRIEAGASAASTIGTGGSTGTPSRSGRTSSRSSGTRSPASSALHRDEGRAQAVDRPLPGEPVQALDERRAARAQAECEAAAGGSLQARRRHRDRGRCAAPDREDGRGQPDPRRDRRDLCEQHDGVVCPPLGGPKASIAELLGSLGEADGCLGVGVERGHADPDPRAVRHGPDASSASLSPSRSAEPKTTRSRVAT